MSDSFHSQATLHAGGREYVYQRLRAVEQAIPAAARLPFSLKILLENLLRTEDGAAVRKADIEVLARWDPAAEPASEIAFTPSRVLLHAFTGVHAVGTLSVKRDRPN